MTRLNTQRRLEHGTFERFGFQRPDGRKNLRPMGTLETRASDLVELIGIEPTTSGLQSPRSPS